MNAVLYLGLVVVVLAAIAFAVAAAVARAKPLKGRGVLAGAIALFLLGVGGGTYWMLGQPYLAWRSAQGVDTRDINGLIALLIKRVRTAPDDLQAWVYLGRAYMSAGDAGDAAKAYARAVTLANNSGHPDAGLDTLYGEALVAQANGDGERRSGSRIPRRADTQSQGTGGALFPGPGAGDAWRQGGRAGAVERLAGGNARQFAAASDPGGPHRAADGAGRRRAPDPKAMVAGLAARLKDNPNDAAGWQRLIRAYSVLGQRAEAQDSAGHGAQDLRRTRQRRSPGASAWTPKRKDLKLRLTALRRQRPIAAIIASIGLAAASTASASRERATSCAPNRPSRYQG